MTMIDKAIGLQRFLTREASIIDARKEHASGYVAGIQFAIMKIESVIHGADVLNDTTFYHEFAECVRDEVNNMIKKTPTDTYYGNGYKHGLFWASVHIEECMNEMDNEKRDNMEDNIIMNPFL